MKDYFENPQDIVDLLNSMLNLDLEKDRDGYSDTIEMRVRGTSGNIRDYSSEHCVVYIDDLKIDSILEQINDAEVYDERLICTDHSAEVLLSDRGDGFTFSRNRRSEDWMSSSTEEDRTFRFDISDVSDMYLCYILWLMEDRGAGKPQRRISMGGLKIEGDHLDIEIFDLLREAYFHRAFSIKVESENRINRGRANTIINSALFEICYSFGVPLIQQSPSVYTDRPRAIRRRRDNDASISVRRIYADDLVHHYIMAASTDNPASKYLSYYHILEHFFSEVPMDNLVDSIQAKITKPGFSYTNKQHIRSIISHIESKANLNQGRVSFNELDSLKLLLRRDVDLVELHSTIKERDQSYITYAQKNSVAFSEGSKVKLTSFENDAVFAHLANRIYSTRNAIVHSKEDSTRKYRPFYDDHHLNREMVLIKSVAELILIKNGTAIE